MKKILLATAVTLISHVAHADHYRAASSSPADRPIFYVLGGAGKADINAPGLESKGVAFQVGGGFVLGKNWAVETTYTNYGKAESAGRDVDASGIGFGFLALANTGKNTAVFARLDAVSVKLGDEKAKVSPSAGIGIQHGFTHGIAARLQYQHTFYTNKNISPERIEMGTLTLQGIKAF